MIAFGVVMSDVFTNEMPQVRLAKNDEVIETLTPDGLDEAFSVRVAVRVLRWNGNAADAAAGEEKFPLLGEQRIAVVPQEPRAAKKAISRIAKVANDLKHPCFVKINTNASDMNDARLELDYEEHHVPDCAKSAERFDGEEVAGVKRRPMTLKECGPRPFLGSFGRWFQSRSVPKIIASVHAASR